MAIKILTEDLIYEVLSVVTEIPVGKVATYGQIAALINRPKNARLVGKILSMSEYYGNFPCHRVVNAAGRLAPHFVNQRMLLMNEGVIFKDADHVDIKRHRWVTDIEY
ncbi:methylated-DNA--[protein]-cysteine S-methyltransferase [Tuanshanicoccus lijuaniae]|uniref:MGMT family protein n=1 Tax=Aerococcaceae bacterium zg-1292 TaxID=2774330 RepID=UPI0019369174|nr:methylated-DNA--[protein]-cysteine S-methyltransferase [Aerococcaceae bacterium zg-1292]MBF6626324.1 methylated-DNA--[protein]-cysteine S-methyltransferase [Aerococcaceae bacterium zg-BR9]MBF6979324.1 methylated-DNA--[protein]-cysteine S-methyltransferase [Aerococcaceae bacterium zg-BR22]QQA37018.1 methylated-DNA--[protein]-cysteine S-methyltransferase [Aerococcaceae bacterium zg-1292]